MGHRSGLWLCEHLIWRTPRLPVLPSSLPHKDKEGVETVAQQGEVEQCSPLYIQAPFLPVPPARLCCWWLSPWLVLDRLVPPYWWLPTGEDRSGGSGSPKDTAGMTGHGHTSLALCL